MKEIDNYDAWINWDKDHTRFGKYYSTEAEADLSASKDRVKCSRVMSGAKDTKKLKYSVDRYTGDISKCLTQETLLMWLGRADTSRQASGQVKFKITIEEC